MSGLRVDLHDVECGECVVLDHGGEILMVDCGSNSRVIRDGNTDFFGYVRGGIMPRYRSAEKRSFLLTHCHRDHLCGLWRILHADPAYFDRLFLPVSPRGRDGRPAALEFALYVYAFAGRMTEYSKMNTAVLRLFSRAARYSGAGRVFPVHAGDTFLSGGVEYEILWPPAEDYPFPREFLSALAELDARLSEPMLPGAAGEFLRLKRKFCDAYILCCRNSPVRREDAAETSALLRAVGRLAPQLRLLPCAQELTGGIVAQGTQRAYSDVLNGASVVFQNRRGGPGSPRSYVEDILMTGDAPPGTIAAVEPSLYDGYYIVKAPHHGTRSAFPPILSGISASHILISGGVGGKTAEEYAGLPGVKHCTSNTVCAYFRAAGSCCNRLARCYEMPRPGLAAVCPARGDPRRAGCGISVVSPSGARACLCDAARP